MSVNVCVRECMAVPFYGDGYISLHLRTALFLSIEWETMTEWQ